jgi:hypothetical protein
MLRFIHIPKTAGTAVIQWLRRNNLECLYGRFKNQQPLHMHRTTDYWQSIDPKDTTYITVVRHPFTRMISYYNYCFRFNPVIDFRQFVVDQFGLGETGPINGLKIPNPWIPQTAWVKNSQGKILVDHILRQEHLQQDLNLYFGINDPVQFVNVSTTNNYSTYVTDELLDHCLRYFREDFTCFGYDPWNI